jgi:pimeloyl-ACP methyl ester carboxylesterase
VRETLRVRAREAWSIGPGLWARKWAAMHEDKTCSGRRGFALCIGLALGVGALVYKMYDPSPVGHFRSEEGYRAYAASYDAAMGQLPAPTRSMDLDTDFGTVRVYEFSSARTRGSTPIVLLPGRTSGVPMWEANLPGLAEERTVYALDALGDAGMSVQTRRIGDAADQAAWLDQALARLGEPKVHLVGHSFGGWLAASYAVRHPERVASLSLLEPVFVFGGLRWQVYVKSIPASVPFLPQSWREAMLSDFGGADEIDPDDPVARMISDATEHYAAKLPLPQRLSKEQLRSLSIPVYVAMAADSSMHDSAAATRVARDNVRDLRIRNWPGATHSLPMEFPERLNRELLGFVAAHDPTVP